MITNLPYLFSKMNINLYWVILWPVAIILLIGFRYFYTILDYSGRERIFGFNIYYLSLINKVTQIQAPLVLPFFTVAKDHNI